MQAKKKIAWKKTPKLRHTIVQLLMASKSLKREFVLIITTITFRTLLIYGVTFRADLPLQV